MVEPLSSDARVCNDIQVPVPLKVMEPIPIFSKEVNDTIIECAITKCSIDLIPCAGRHAVPGLETKGQIDHIHGNSLPAHKCTRYVQARPLPYRIKLHCMDEVRLASRQVP